MEVQQCRHMLFVSHTLFVIVLSLLISTWKPHPYFVCECMHKIQPFTGLHRAIPSIDCFCRLRSATLVEFQLHTGLLLCKARVLDLCKATPTFLKHFLVPVILSESHTALCSTGYTVHLLIHRYTVDFSSIEHSVHAVNYSVVILKVREPSEVVRIGTKVITRTHLCKGQQSTQLKVADLLLKPPWNNSRQGRNFQTELKSTVLVFAGTYMHSYVPKIRQQYKSNVCLGFSYLGYADTFPNTIYKHIMSMRKNINYNQ